MKRITVELRHQDRPWTINAERRLHPMQRHVLVKRWREAFCLLALEAKLPRDLSNVSITVTPYLENRRGIQDVGAAFPAAKAAIDGLVDARVMEDDNPSILQYLGFNAPIFGQGNALVLEVTGDVANEDSGVGKSPQPRKRPHQGYARKARKVVK